MSCFPPELRGLGMGKLEVNETVRCWSGNSPFSRGYGSLEHVIPNAGHLTSRDLLCEGCNKAFGSDIDSELEKQLGILGDLLGIKKQRADNYEKVHKLVAEDGNVRKVGKKLKPLSEMVFPTPKDGHKTINVLEAKAEEFVKQKTKELKAHGLDTVFVESSRLPDGKRYKMTNNLTEKHGDIAFGGISFMRAIGKIAINFAALNGVDTDLLSKLIGFVKGENEDSHLVAWYYPTNYKIHQLEADEVNHLIHLKGDKKQRMLYAYIELFSCQNLIVLLSTEYDGEEIEKTYAFDLLQTEETHKSVNIKMTRDHLLHLWMSHGLMVREHLHLFNRLERIIEKRQSL